MSEPRFRRYLLGRSISAFGNNLAPVALTFGVLEQSRSAALLGIILACEILPQAVLTLFGGVIADRFARGAVMVWASLVSFLTQLGLAVVFFLGEVNFVLVGLLAAVGGASFAFFAPAAQGIVPQLVSPHDVHDANGLLRTFQNLARLAGPAAAGVIVCVGGPGWAFMIDALTFLIAAVAFVSLRDALALRPPSTLLADLRLGWDDFCSRSWLWAIVLQYAVINIAWGAGFQVLGPLMFEVNGSGSAGWGVVLSAFAFGIVAGAVTATKIRPHRPLLWAVNGSFLKALPMLALAFDATTLGVAVAAIFAGIGTEIFIVNFYSTMHREVPQDRLSRVSSYDILFGIALAPLGYVIAAPVAGVLGNGGLAIACAGLVFAATALTLSVRTVRNMTCDGAP